MQSQSIPYARGVVDVAQRDAAATLELAERRVDRVAHEPLLAYTRGATHIHVRVQSLSMFQERLEHWGLCFDKDV